MKLTAKRTGRRWHASVRGGLLATIVAGAAMACVETATAQITVKQLIGSAVSDAESQQYVDVENAIIRFRNRDYDGAQKLLQASKTKNPNLAPAQVMLAQLFFLAKENAAGVTALELAVKSEPADPEAYIILGDIAMRQRGLTGAGLLFAKGNDLCEKYTRNQKRKQNLQIRSLAGMAAVAEGRQDWAAAKKHLEAWAAADKENTAAMARLGRVLFELEDEKGAYAKFREIQEIDEEVTRPEITMAVLYERSDRHDNAKHLMTLAADRDGGNARTRLAIAQWAIETGEEAMARENTAAALRADPDSLQAKLLVAFMGRISGDFVNAEKLFREVVARTPGNFAATNQLALSLIEQPDETKRGLALAYAKLNAQTYSDGKQATGREAAVTLSWVYFRLGREADAERAMGQILTAGGVSAESAYYAARVFNDRGRPDVALKILEPTLGTKRLFPHRKEAQTLLDKLKQTVESETTTPKGGE